MQIEKSQKQAAEALGLHIYGMEKDGDGIPIPSKTPQVDPETAAGNIVSPVTVFPDLVRNELDNRAVKTNLTIPAWLKEMAEVQGESKIMNLLASLYRIKAFRLLSVRKYVNPEIQRRKADAIFYISTTCS